MINIRDDLSIDDTLASQWWDVESLFSCSLHAMNRLTLDEIIQVMGLELHGAILIDLGCGGGLLARPLAERGATVLASDLNKRSVRESHLCGIGTRLHALVADVLRPLFSTDSTECAECADIILCADFIEHIPQWREVLAHAADLLKPGGRIFVSTLTRTRLSSLLGIYLAEGLGFVPTGTYDPASFGRPHEIAEEAAKLNLEASVPVGITPCLWHSAVSRTLQLRRTRRVMVSYAMWLTKPRSTEWYDSGTLPMDHGHFLEPRSHSRPTRFTPNPKSP